MTAAPVFEKLEFHGSTLDEISVDGSTVRMFFESILYPPLETERDDYPLISVTLWIDGVTRIIQDHQPVQTLSIQGSYGSVVDLKRTGHEIVLAVSWNHFEADRKDRDVFSTISLRGETLAVRCGPYTYEEPRQL